MHKKIDNELAALFSVEGKKSAFSIVLLGKKLDSCHITLFIDESQKNNFHFHTVFIKLCWQ